jgi:hypothetical protein
MTKHTRLIILEASKARVLVLLLVVLLFVCHGTMGAVHLCSAAHVSPTQTHESELSMETGALDLGHSACHVASSTEYLGVLLFVAFSGLLLRGARYSGRIAVSRSFERRFHPLLLCSPSRGPSAPLLGTFRL